MYVCAVHERGLLDMLQYTTKRKLYVFEHRLCCCLLSEEVNEEWREGAEKYNEREITKRILCTCNNERQQKT